MKMEISLSRKIAFGFAIGLLILIVIGLASYRNTREFTESAAVVAQSHRVMTLLSATLEDIVSAESEVRGYIITGDERYLKLYRQAVSEIEGDFKDLRSSVADDNIHRRVNDLALLTRKRLERLQTTITTRKLEGFEAVLEITGPGKKLMDELRQVITDINRTENNLLNERKAREEALAGQTMLVVMLGSLFAVIFAAASTLVVTTDLAHRERLEREVLEISEREQRRIGQDLHDGVCQHLTGIALLSRSLQQKLADRSAAEAKEATRITDLINDGIEQTRRVTHGLSPVVNEQSGLMLALQDLTASVSGANKLLCRFECPVPVPVSNQMTATHLYRIAQEALQNAIRHARPTTITISLEMTDECLVLTVTDDGCGITPKHPKRGLGLEIMSYRAHSIGGRLEVRPGIENGTVVTCTLPRDSLA